MVFATRRDHYYIAQGGDTGDTLHIKLFKQNIWKK